VGEDHPSPYRFRPRLAFEFFEEVGKGNAVETVPSYAGRLVTAGDGEEARGRQEVAVKVGVEASDLRDAREPSGDGFDEFDRRRQVGGGERGCRPKVGEQPGGNNLRLGMGRAAVDDALADGRRPAEFAHGLQPVEQTFDRLFDTRGRHRPPLVGTVGTGDPQEGVGEPDSFDCSDEMTLELRVAIKEGELDARRTAVDGQYATFRRHQMRRRGWQVIHGRSIHSSDVVATSYQRTAGKWVEVRMRIGFAAIFIE
jgi:hypothetical protein